MGRPTAETVKGDTSKSGGKVCKGFSGRNKSRLPSSRWACERRGQSVVPTMQWWGLPLELAGHPRSKIDPSVVLSRPRILEVEFPISLSRLQGRKETPSSHRGLGAKALEKVSLCSVLFCLSVTLEPSRIQFVPKPNSVPMK